MEENKTQEPRYKLFNGRYIDAMPKLLAENRTPLTIRDILKRRIAFQEPENKTGIDWWHGYYETCSGVAYYQGKIKIVPKADLLLKVNSDSRLSKGSLVLTEEQFNSLDGKTFTRQELEKAGLHNYPTKTQPLAHPAWKTLAGDILEQYVDIYYTKYPYEHTGLGVWIGRKGEQDQPVLRSLNLEGGVEANSSRLDDGYHGLGGKHSQLYGILKQAKADA